MRDDKFVCRCNDVTVGEVENAMDEGLLEIEQLRKKLRIGMGNCQGRTCLELLQAILAKRLRVTKDKVPLPLVRAPLIPVPLQAFVGVEEGVEKKESLEDKKENLVGDEKENLEDKQKTRGVKTRRLKTKRLKTGGCQK
jgi:bacterioferritin-associated ferredoxin